VTPAGMKRLQNKQGKGRAPKEVSITKRLTVEKVRIIAHCLFDGTVVIGDGEYKIKYTNASWGLIEQFMNDMRVVYGIDPVYVGFNKGKNHPWWEVQYCSKKVVEDLLKYSPSYSTSDGVSLPKGVSRRREFILTFLRAFWEDEGSIDHVGRLTTKSKSWRLIYSVRRLHRSLGIHCSIWHDRRSSVYVIYIKKKFENFRRFQEEIGFDKSIVTRGKFVGLRKNVIFNSFLARQSEI